MVMITGLKTHRTDPRRVDIVLDDRRRMTVPAEAASGLRLGMVLDPDTAESLEARAATAEAMGKVGRMLARRPHAVAEVRRRLRERGFPEAVVDDVVRELESRGDLDDVAFARAWVENRDTFRPRGAAMIRSELIRKGVPREAIETALEDFDERRAATAEAGRMAGRWTSLDEDERKHRVYQHLARRGFDHEIIRSVMKQAREEGAERESESEGTL
jgi:regulatory protein